MCTCTLTALRPMQLLSRACACGRARLRGCASTERSELAGRFGCPTVRANKFATLWMCQVCTRLTAASWHRLHDAASLPVWRFALRCAIPGQCLRAGVDNATTVRDDGYCRSPTSCQCDMSALWALDSGRHVLACIALLTGAAFA